MTVLSQCPGVLQSFAALVDRRSPVRRDEQHEVHVLELEKSANSGVLSPYKSSLCTVRELAQRESVDLRIVFAPLDYPEKHTLNLLLDLFHCFDCPADFVTERIQSVTHSFGNQRTLAGDQWFWFHFLCKNIGVDCQDSLWVKSGYLLKCDSRQKITLLCFGDHQSLETKLQDLSPEVWHRMAGSYLEMFPVILSELHRRLDNQVWSLVGQVGKLEQIAIHGTQSQQNSEDFDFVSLHHVAKNVIHVMEASEAMMKTVVHIGDCHPDGNTTPGVKYQQTLFESVNLRLMSLEKRMQNIIDLSFNLITHRDSKVILQESGSMHTIAFASLVFLPISTVASIFGTQFFDFDPDAPNNDVFRVASTFKYFWIIVVPLTLFILSIWSYFNRHTLPKWLKLAKAERVRTRRNPASYREVRDHGV